MRLLLRSSALPTAVLFLTFAAGCNLGEIEHTGTLTYVEQEGGFWGIVLEDGTRFRLLNLPREFEQEGIEVEIEGMVVDEERREGEWGIPIRLTEVEVQIDK